MRWAYLGNFGPHNTESEIAKAIRANGWDVDEYQEGDQSAMAALIDNAPAYDVIAWTRTKSLADRTGDALAWKLLTVADRAGVPTIGLHLDRWIGLEREIEITESPFFRCSTLFTADGGHPGEWDSYGVNHVWFPPAVSEFECIPGTPRDEYRSPLAFVGSWDGYGHAEATHRPALVAWLRENYRDRVKFWPERGQPAIRGEALRDLYASVDVVVGDSCILPSDTGGRYWSDRVPETLGRFGFLLHPWTEGLTEAFPYMPTWQAWDWDALRSAIDYWLDPANFAERRQLESNNFARVLNTATYSVRMAEVAETLGLADGG